MFVRASASSGGVGSIPFTIVAITGSGSIPSQNCYLWNDNGTVKMHMEFSFIASKAISANSNFIQNFLPVNSQISSTTNMPSGYVLRVNSSNIICLSRNTAISSGQTVSLNQDVICTY